MSAYYVLSYLAFCLPSLLAGNLTRTFGLVVTTDGYGAVLIILSAGALLALMRQQSMKVCGVDVR
jgi:predicted methyltransferase MtxX (methanogen marker protein 4)